MTAPEIGIVALAVIQCLAVAGMGIAGFMLFRRAKTVADWAQPSVQEARAIAGRGKATALETKNRALDLSGRIRTLVRHVGQKVQTTSRLAREVVRPDLKPLQEAARSVIGPDGLASRLSRLHEAGKIAAGKGNGRGADR
jgi:hypothetical protein